jgi:hypothetical protein
VEDPAGLYPFLARRYCDRCRRREHTVLRQPTGGLSSGPYARRVVGEAVSSVVSSREVWAGPQKGANREVGVEACECDDGTVVDRWEWRRVVVVSGGWRAICGQAGRVVAMHRAGGRERGRRQQTVRVATGSGGHPVLGRPGHSVATPCGRLLSAGRRITAGAARVGGRPVGGQVMPFASRGWMTVEGLCWRGRGVVGPVPSGSTVPAVGSGRSSDDRVDDRTTLRSVGETGPWGGSTAGRGRTVDCRLQPRSRVGVPTPAAGTSRRCMGTLRYDPGA